MLEDAAAVVPVDSGKRHPLISDTDMELPIGSDASRSGSDRGSCFCSCLPSRVCSTPASETSEPLGFDFWQSYLQDLAPCHIPISDIEIPSASLSRSVGILLDDPALLHSFCHQSGLTPATIFKVGWLLLLQSYTGQNSVCFDILSANDKATSICCYDFTADQKIADVLAYVQQDYLHSLFQQDVSMAAALQWLNLTKERACNTAVCLQNEKVEGPINQIRRYDVLLELRQYGTDLSAVLTYRSSAITESHARRISATFRTILQSMLESPKRSISSVQRVSVEDRQQILKWNETPSPILDQCLHHAFTEKALDNPDALAVRAWDGELTYGELDEVSTCLAGYIDGLIDPSQRGMAMIPFGFERSGCAIITILAILKTGSACVPLDSSAPDSELQEKLLNVGAQIICVSASNADKFATFEGKVVIVNSALLENLRKNKCDFEPSDRRGEIAFVQYTAGTTGKPKGVMQSHAALYTGILSQGQSLGYDEDSKVLQHAPYTKAASIGDIFGTFFYNACLVVPSEEQINEDLTGTINNEEITHACLAPSVARNLSSDEVYQLTSLVLGGEPLESCDIEAWSYATELVKAYGTVETSVLCTISKSPSPNVFLPSNIGTPLTASAWIVDPQDVNKLLPVGCVGELVISGPTLASGYLNDEVATANVFITDPAWAGFESNATQQRFFRTGDLAKYLATGELAFCGRKRIKSIGVSKDE
ncbi:acetyl-CoA synthetase-like protein [Lepidopterella palustris CBS 459.81]|uniref:Acetyl-CoA synthetase-like protein n=1 Tax=Lepidopterella palustris CBS 459.81 TaxID=1314670 RepID=A0A8E2E0B1_9PEZI|nr:acetyl-CoA synthetase-like protein [Lepidopterella palustris CBS 459.81]